ncbi:MAG: DUF5985 family protein [Acidobacteriia bacterium]|nr:DUF5985 family protein [Terriglobia bacterium]
MNSVVYLLASVTNLGCAFLLLRAFAAVRRRLLLWSGLCFAGLAASSLLVFVDLVMLPETDLYLLRLAIGVVAMGLLVYGLILEEP